MEKRPGRESERGERDENLEDGEPHRRRNARSNEERRDESPRRRIIVRRCVTGDDNDDATQRGKDTMKIEKIIPSCKHSMRPMTFGRNVKKRKRERDLVEAEPTRSNRSDGKVFVKRTNEGHG